MIIEKEEAPAEIPTPHLPDFNLWGHQSLHDALLSDEGLPSYSTLGRTAQQRTQHAFSYQKDGRRWLTLNVTSRAPSDKHLPSFIGPSAITGSVELDPASPEKILAIDITLTGTSSSLTMGPGAVASANTHRFLRTSQTLWTASNAHKSVIGRLRHLGGEKVDSKLDLSFSIQIPECFHVPAGPGRDASEDPLPASFMEVGAGLSVVYDIEVCVKRGPFGVDSVLATKILYAPLTRPDWFPPLRRACYEQGLGQLVPPAEDPTGWMTVGPIITSGRLFGIRDVSVSCTLSLAKPLAYTRSSCIPIHLSISTSDSQALDLLSSPGAPVVALLAYLEANLDSTSVQRLVGAAKPTQQGDNTIFLESRIVQSAVWWPDFASVPAEKQERRLFGEIHLTSGMTPPFDIADGRLRYRVALMPFSASGFTSLGERNTSLDVAHQALATQDVDIVTAYAGAGSGNKPVMVTPPSYTKAEPWPISNAMDKSGYI